MFSKDLTIVSRVVLATRSSEDLRGVKEWFLSENCLTVRFSAGDDQEKDGSKEEVILSSPIWKYTRCLKPKHGNKS